MSSNNNEKNYDVMGAEGTSVDKAKYARKTLIRLMRAMKPQKMKLITAFLFAIGGVGLNLYAPVLFANAINTLYAGVAPSLAGEGPVNIDFAILGMDVLFLIGIYGFSALLTYCQEISMATVSQQLVLSLRKQISQKFSKLPLKFYDTNKRGEVLSRVTNDLERINETLRDAIMRLLTSALTIVGSIILMVRISGGLTLIAIGSIVIGVLITMLIGKKTNQLFLTRQQKTGSFNAQIEEYFSGQVEIKSFNLENQVNDKTQKAIEELYRADKKASFMMFAIMPIIRLFNQIGYVLIAALGARLVISGTISIGKVLSFFQYVQMSQEPLAEGAFVINSVQGAIASAERVFEILDENEESQSLIKRTIKRPNGDISFDNVKFGYGESLLMNNVSFDVKAGQKIAIVGPTGAGKTTLINLLMRFYEINSGKITIDGLDIKSLDREYLRSLFGMVLQDSWMYAGKITENISYGRPNSTMEEIVRVAKLTKVDHFIRTLPHGYDTVIDDESATLSQGEKQLICITRAVLTDPKILLLDEATSSVDTRTELAIQEAMDQLMHGRTSFIIAHRLSTIKNADKILVMDKGDVVEVGTHEELLAKNGMYSDIYNSQFKAA